MCPREGSVEVILKQWYAIKVSQPALWEKERGKKLSCLSICEFSNAFFLLSGFQSGMSGYGVGKPSTVIGII